MARLLVSVRSAEDARAALAGGASILDVKEPARGPLGRADVELWRAVRDVAPRATEVSVALGELLDPTLPDDLARFDFQRAGIAYVKLGLAGAGRLDDWPTRWSRIRTQVGAGPRWVAVAYLDWQAAAAPSPEDVVNAAIHARPDCAGLLVDSFDKSRATPILETTWTPLIERARAAGLFTALAGRLDAVEIRRLATLRPDVFAVRGAACRDGDRAADVDRARVAVLVQAAAQSDAALEPAPSNNDPSWSRIGSAN